MDHKKYGPPCVFSYKNRTWPDAVILKAPVWCSVDLRDGNQALTVPMSFEQKLLYFKFLTGLGFKEIEIGFPAANDTEYNFTRALIENGLIPDDVTVQVLTQARPHLIDKTFESLAGAKKAIVHLYNSTSAQQREIVFNMGKDDIKGLAVSGAVHALECALRSGGERFIFEYSPESFNATEPDYALEIISAVLDVWRPDKNNKVIINLPSTVETATPNEYADRVEYICANVPNRENVIISLHTHNDRGCAVAAAELGLMAGADRIEGTLFGNGERTGNSCIINLAMNMYSHGIDPMLDFSEIDKAIEIYESSSLMNVHARHPYAGELVYTAFSGSHQDAINKGVARVGKNYSKWDVPYLPIDPADVGRNYENIIRINAQSGKGGVAYILEHKYKMIVPKAMRADFAAIVTKKTDAGHKELLPEEIYDLFESEYINVTRPLSLVKFSEATDGETRVSAEITKNGALRLIEGRGIGLLDAFCRALIDEIKIPFEITNYSEHSLEFGSQSRAITYLQIRDKNGADYFGAGVSESISRSSVRAVVSAVNKIAGIA